MKPEEIKRIKKEQENAKLIEMLVDAHNQAMLLFRNQIELTEELEERIKVLESKLQS